MDNFENEFVNDFSSQLKRLKSIQSTVNNVAVSTDLSKDDCFRLIDEVSREMVQTYPGEHYRWLSAYVISQKPLRILELGTKNGLSLLALFTAGKKIQEKTYKPRIATVDINNVQKRRHFIPEEVINSDQVTLVTGDAVDIHTYDNLGFPLSECDFVFLDTLHTGFQEAEVLCTLFEAGLTDNVTILADDISLNPEMSLWWKTIAFPKIELDLHFSGSGLCSFKRDLISTNFHLINEKNKKINPDDLNKQLVLQYVKNKIKKYFKYPFN